MEEKFNPWKLNLTNGLILGLIGIVYSLLMYFLDLSLNKTQSYVFILVQIVVLFFLLKSYRDNARHGQITYAQALGAGVIICLYYSIIMAVFSYINLTIIDPGLVAKQMAMSEEAITARGLPQASVDAAMKMQAKFMKPAIMSFFVLFGGIFWGLVLSLIISIFVKKEGNPLIDAPAN